jgi:hypothetical protein
VTLDAPSATVGHLVLGKRRHEAGGWPALFVGLCGDLGPGFFDAVKPLLNVTVTIFSSQSAVRRFGRTSRRGRSSAMRLRFRALR